MPFHLMKAANFTFLRLMPGMERKWDDARVGTAVFGIR